MVLKETLIIILGTIHGQYGQSLMAKVTSMTNLVVSNTVLSSGILLLTLGSEACMPTVGKFLSWQFFFFLEGGDSHLLALATPEMYGSSVRDLCMWKEETPEGSFPT